MKTIALTGGLGMGKSTCAQLLCNRGLVVVDSDDLARAVVQPGQPALNEIRDTFGDAMFGADGQLRRAALAEKVFAEPQLRAKLERILHPRIQQLWEQQLQSWRAGGHPWGAVVIPLLFEIGAQSQFDIVICVACSAASQLERLRQRGWSDDEIAARNAAQLPVAVKMAQSNFVIWTECDREGTAHQLDHVLQSIGSAVGRH